jgi:hypothetical protein
MQLYDELYGQAAKEADEGTLGSQAPPKPPPPSEIKPLPTTIGIEEGRGGATPAPSPRSPQK